jgi:predicted metal-binding protein
MTYYFNINPQILSNYFDEQVREWCKNCKRYGVSASCPPNIQSIEFYKTIVNQFSKGVLIIQKFTIDDPQNWQILGKNSSEELRNTMENLIPKLKIYSLYYLFGGGSCKHCEKCTIPCTNGNKLIPIEAIGLNVIKLTKDIANINLKFPVESQGFFYRIGLIIYE